MPIVRFLIVVLTLSGCHFGRPAEHALPPEHELISNSHAILEAYDHGDLATVRATLGAGYVHFEGSVIDREKELAQLAKWTRDGPHVGQRRWSDEHVFAAPGHATFIGRAVEKQAGNDVHGGYTFDGWYTLGWASQDGVWKLVYWSWRIAGAQSLAGSWNQIYSNGTGFEHQPNKLLVTYSQQHAPGTAIDITMGQGRNALYLAAQGWRVTGVDIADEGIRQARTAAEQKHLALDAVVADVKTYDYGTAKWDLVAMIYAWPALSRIGDLQAALKPGGLFVYEYFAHIGDNDDSPAPGALAKQFAGWDILVDEIVDGVPDWAADRAKLQRFVARKR